MTEFKNKPTDADMLPNSTRLISGHCDGNVPVLIYSGTKTVFSEPTSFEAWLEHGQITEQVVESDIQIVVTCQTLQDLALSGLITACNRCPQQRA